MYIGEITLHEEHIAVVYKVLTQHVFDRDIIAQLICVLVHTIQDNLPHSSAAHNPLADAH